MSVNIVLTTADDIVAVIDAVNAKGYKSNIGFIREFTGIATDNQAINALEMAVYMQMLKIDISDNTYSINSKLAKLLVTTTKDDYKAAIMRLILEQFDCFVFFIERFYITQNIESACSQTKAMYSFISNERDIKSTFVSLATYAKIIKRDSANSYSFYREDQNNYLLLINEAIDDKMINESTLRNYFGDSIYLSLNRNNIINPLTDSFLKSKQIPLDTRAVILYAGNAIESFLEEYANLKVVSLVGKNGIISKLSVFSSTDISKKHRGVFEYIGQVRNAADHGADSSEHNLTWMISKETAIIFPMIVASLIKNVIQRDNGIIEI